MPQRKRKTPKLPRLTHMAASRQGVEVAEAGTHREDAGTAISGIDLQQHTHGGPGWTCCQEPFNEGHHRSLSGAADMDSAGF